MLLCNKYADPPYCRAEMYAGRVACCPLVSHGKYADGTDGQTTPYRYSTLSVMDATSAIIGISLSCSISNFLKFPGTAYPGPRTVVLLSPLYPRSMCIRPCISKS